MFQPRVLTIAIIAATLGVAGCNSNDDDGSQRFSAGTSAPTMTTITVTPSLGKIRNAKVILRSAKTNQELAPAKLLSETTGTAQFSVPISKLAEPIIASVLPNDTGDVQYFDEATNQLTTIAITTANRDTPILRAAATVGPNANMGVTALTEAAVQTAEAKPGGLLVNIDSINALIKAELKLAYSILQAPVVIGELTQYSQLANASLAENQRAYAAYLANLAKQAALLNPSSSQPAFDIVKTLSADFKDDSQLNASFDAQQFIIAYNAAFATAWADVANALIAALKNLPANTTNFDAFFNTVGESVPVATPIRVVDGVAEYACADEDKLRSSNGTQSINIDFINQSGSNLNIFWLNYAGQRTSYKQGLATTQTHSQQTFVTHPWVVTDAAGLCKGILRPLTQTNKTLTFNVNGTTTIGSTPPPTSTQILHPAMVRTYFGKIWHTTGTGIPARTPCSISLTEAGELSMNVASVRYSVTIPDQIIDADSDMTKDNNHINSVGSYATTWTGRAHVGGYGMGWAHYTSSNLADGPISVDTLPYANGSYGTTPQIVCDTYSTTGGAASLGDGVAGAAEIGSDGSFKAATVIAKAQTNSRVQTWTDPAYGEISVTYGLNSKAISNISVKRTVGSAKTFDCSGNSCAGAGFSGVNKVPSLVLNNVTVTGASTQILNGVLLESPDANNPPVDNSNTCSSQGADDKLGFTNAPTDFCSFSKISSTAISAPDIYTFVNGTANVKVTVENGIVSNVLAENNTYAFACGAGGTNPACSGITFHNTASYKEFVFSNTTLAPLSGTGQAITVQNGSLIHQTPVTGGTTIGGSPSFTQGTSFGGSAVVPTTGANNFKLVILTDGIPPYGHASKIAFSGTHSSNVKSTTVVGFATKADQDALSATQYVINGYSVDVVGQELQINIGGYRCSFDANKPFAVYGNSTNGVAVSYQTPFGLDANCNVQLTFGLDNVLTNITMTQINATPNAATPYSITAGLNAL